MAARGAATRRGSGGHACPVECARFHGDLRTLVARWGLFAARTCATAGVLDVRGWAHLDEGRAVVTSAESVATGAAPTVVSTMMSTTGVLRRARRRRTRASRAPNSPTGANADTSVGHERLHVRRPRYHPRQPFQLSRTIAQAPGSAFGRRRGAAATGAAVHHRGGAVAHDDALAHRTAGDAVSWRGAAVRPARPPDRVPARRRRAVDRGAHPARGEAAVTSTAKWSARFELEQCNDGVDVGYRGTDDARARPRRWHAEHPR